MSPENSCPACGSPIENNNVSICPSCGTTLNKSASSAPTLISKKSTFANSAEVMDEVKNLIREGDTNGATKIASTEFGINEADARNTVEQTELDMKYSGKEAPPSDQSPIAEPVEVIESPSFDEPKKVSNSKRWIIGGSVGAVIFLCLCCCLPLIIAVSMFFKGK